MSASILRSVCRWGSSPSTVALPVPQARRLAAACVCKFVCSSCFCCYFLLLVLIILLLCFLNYSYCLTLPGYDDVDVRSGGVGDQD